MRKIWPLFKLNNKPSDEPNPGVCCFKPAQHAILKSGNLESGIQEGFHILNTNYRNDSKDHETMLKEHVAGAFFTPWKEKIDRINKGDVVFLYQSGVGVVALGVASGKLQKRAYQGNPEYQNEDFSMPLLKFELVDPPMEAMEIKQTCGVNYRFMSTLFPIDAEAGRNLEMVLRSRKKK